MICDDMKYSEKMNLKEQRHVSIDIQPETLLGSLELEMEFPRGLCTEFSVACMLLAWQTCGLVTPRRLQDDYPYAGTAVKFCHRLFLPTQKTRWRKNNS
jgi:hypothetical protein